MKYKSIVFFVIILLMPLSACSKTTTSQNDVNSSQSEDIGFESSEELMNYFTEQIRQGNFENASAVFAIELMSKNYDLEKQIEYMRIWYTTFTMPYPSEDASYVQANRIFLKAQVMRQIANMCFSLNADEEYLQQTIVTIESGEGEAIAESFLLHNLDSFKMIKMNYALPDSQDSEKHRANIKKRNEIYGADDFSEYVVYYEWNSQQYIGGITLIKYGDLWYLYALQSNLAGTPASSYLEKVQ